MEGAKAIAADALKSQLALAAGRPFYRPQLAVDRDTIGRAYRGQGFQSVSVVSQLAFADNPGPSPRGVCAVGCDRRVAITWTIREGEQITVDRVLINGRINQAQIIDDAREKAKTTSRTDAAKMSKRGEA